MLSNKTSKASLHFFALAIEKKCPKMGLSVVQGIELWSNNIRCTHILLNEEPTGGQGVMSATPSRVAMNGSTGLVRLAGRMCKSELGARGRPEGPRGLPPEAVGLDCVDHGLKFSLGMTMNCLSDLYLNCRGGLQFWVKARLLRQRVIRFISHRLLRLTTQAFSQRLQSWVAVAVSWIIQSSLDSFERIHDTSSSST
jgi:hypothetical protein